ncbi:MAG: S9 family peptidase, partial [Erysipelotrichaceae bacterium]|nr:S9 family peptidase [Erysipelotrichaceae bacterium]
VNEDEMMLQSAWYFNEGILLMGNKVITHGLNENGRFYFLKDNEMTLLYDNVMSTHNSVGSDCRYGGGAGSKVVGDKFYYTTTKDKDGIIVSIDKKGNYKEELLLDGSVDCFDIQNGKIYYIAMKDGALQELYCDNQKLTDLNTDVLKDTYVAKYQEIPFENDGMAFTGWVLLPKDYDPNKKYPAILDIHGGPKTAYGTVFYHEMQLWANMGYFVFFTNPRGSDGKDNDFMDIFGKYGTIDYDDLMRFTDVVLETYPAIDSSKVGVTGGSYGGFMTNWIIGHTDRFACAATQRSISNWISFYGTSDIGMFFAEDQIHGNVFNKPEKLWEHSPLKYADNIVTPTLFIHSDEDYRCPLEQGLQLYTAIVDKGIDTRFVLFHGENHELSRGGKPKHRVRRLEEITDWMEKYLK